VNPGPNGCSLTAAPPTTPRRSHTSMSSPLRARYAAATSPLCPPPTTTTSRGFAMTRISALTCPGRHVPALTAPHDKLRASPHRKRTSSAAGHIFVFKHKAAAGEMVDATAGTAPGPVRTLHVLGHLRTTVPGRYIPAEVDRRLRAVLARRDP